MGDLGEPPHWLTDSQKENWRYIIEHAPRGLLKKIDVGILTVFVIHEDIHRRAAQELAVSEL